MKKLAISSILLMLCAIPAMAQDFGWGPKIGMNSSRLTHSTRVNKQGLTFGAFAGLRFTRMLEVEVSAMYSQQGAKMDNEPLSDGRIARNVKTRVDYLNFPVVLKCYVIGGLNLFAGPQFSAILSAKHKYHIASEDTKVVRNIKPQMKSGDVALVLGAGYQFKFGLNLAINYNVGMINTLKYGDVLDELHDRTKNGNFQITAGWRF